MQTAPVEVEVVQENSAPLFTAAYSYRTQEYARRRTAGSVSSGQVGSMCFHFLTRAVRIARGDPAERFSRRLGSSGYRFSRRLAATRLLYRHRRSS